MVWGGKLSAQAFACLSGVVGTENWKSAFSPAQRAVEPKRYELEMPQHQTMEILAVIGRVAPPTLGRLHEC